MDNGWGNRADLSIFWYHDDTRTEHATLALENIYWTSLACASSSNQPDTLTIAHYTHTDADTETHTGVHTHARGRAHFHDATLSLSLFSLALTDATAGYQNGCYATGCCQTSQNLAKCYFYCSGWKPLTSSDVPEYRMGVIGDCIQYADDTPCRQWRFMRDNRLLRHIRRGTYSMIY